MKMVLASLVIVGAFSAEAAVATHAVTKEVPAAHILRIVVDVPTAEVMIRNTNEKALRVTGTYSKSYRGDNSADAQAVVDSADLKIETSGPRATISRELDGPSDSFLAKRSLDLKLEIFAPPHVNVEVKQRSGNVTIDGSFRNLDVKMTSGDVSVRTAKRNVRELTASSRVGEVNANVGSRTVSRQGVMAGPTYFINDDGTSTVNVAVRFGRVDIELTP